MQRRRRRFRHVEPVDHADLPVPDPDPAPDPDPPQVTVVPHRPSPHDLAERPGAFAMTAQVQDPEPVQSPPLAAPVVHAPPAARAPNGFGGSHASGGEGEHDEVAGERGLRGLVGGGASQVSIAAAMRARDAARPTDRDVATAEAELVIVRRGWVPREDLPRRKDSPSNGRPRT